MDKIEVTICTGTTCYVMGAADLLALQDEAGPTWEDRIVFKGCGCLGLCKDGQYGKAPFVKINDTLISEATAEDVIQAINKLVEPQE